MLKDPIVITGIGMLDANGYTPKMCWDTMLKGTTVPVNQVDEEKYTNVKIKRSFTVEPYMQHLDLNGLDSRTLRTIPKTMSMCYHVAKTALEDSKIDLTTNGACVVTSVGDSREAFRYVANALDNGVQNLNPFKQLWATANWIGGFLGASFNLTGPNFHTTAACASGLAGLYNAKCMLQADPAIDFVVVTGADQGTDRSFRFFFNTIQALSPDDADNCSRPFDVTRNGFVTGDGAASFVVERMSSALKRGATIYGELAGFGNYKENAETTSPDKNGTGSKAAMKQALMSAGVHASDIDYVNAHATSTPVGDDIEAKAIAEVISPVVPVSSVKGSIGHTFGAASLLEVGYSLLAMKNNIAPATQNLITPCSATTNIITNHVSTPINNVMKNSFAFNGRCVSVVLSKI